MKSLCIVSSLILLLAPLVNAAASRSKAVRTVKGIVIDADGKSIPGALLEVSRAGTFRWDSQAKSDETGHFTLHLGKGTHVVTAMAPGYAALGHLVKDRPDSEPAPLRMALVRGGITLTGKVIDPHENPVLKGEVWAQDIGAFKPVHIFHTTLDRGSFTLSLPSGGYRLFWRCPGFRLGREFVKLKTSTSLTLRAHLSPGPAGPEVLAWIRNQAVPLRTAEPDGNNSDLEALGNMIGGAKVVGLGEATHGTHEFQSIKQRVVEYMVAKKGFTVFAIEDDFNNAIAINDYVLNGKGDPEAALAKMIGWWDSQEVLALILWMRAWNADPVHTNKVSFWGVDVRSLRGPYQAFEPWLKRMMPAFAERLKAAGVDEAFVNQVSDHRRETPAGQVRKAKDLMTELLSELEVYAGSHPSEHLSEIRLNVELSRTYLEDVSNPDDMDIRDRFMAENVKAILTRAGQDAKGIVWAHNGHVASIADHSGIGTSIPMGQHLRKAFGPDYFVVGFSFNRGRFLAHDQPFPGIRGILEFEVGPAPENFVDGALAKIKHPIFVMNLRALPLHGPVKTWFETERPIWSLGGGFDPMEPEYTIYSPEISVPRAFDALIHVGNTTPVRLNPPEWDIANLVFSGNAPSPSNLEFREVGKDGTPKGWQFTSLGPTEISQGSSLLIVGRAVAMNNPDGGTILTVHPFKDNPDRAPILAQVVDPGPYRGRTVILSAWVRKGEGTGDGEVRLWGRVRRSNALGDYQVDLKEWSDQQGWTKLEIELTVAPDASELAYGLSIIGPVPVQVRDFEIHLLVPKMPNRNERNSPSSPK